MFTVATNTDTGLGELPAKISAAGWHERTAAKYGSEPGVKGLVRTMYIAAAALFFGLGLCGIILPGLPATPFFLLTSYFLARSSPRMHQRLLACTYIGPIVQEWNQHRGVSLRTKYQAMAFVILGASTTCWLSSLPFVGRFLVGVAAALGFIVIARLPRAGKVHSTTSPTHSGIHRIGLRTFSRYPTTLTRT